MKIDFSYCHFRALFPCGDDLVCIIDDREDVWQGCGNLVQVKPYHFFRHTGDINAPPGMEKSDPSHSPGPVNKSELCINNLQTKDSKNGTSELSSEPAQLSLDNPSEKETNHQEDNKDEKTEDKTNETKNEDTKASVEENKESNVQSNITNITSTDDNANKDDEESKEITKPEPEPEPKLSLEKDSKQEMSKEENNIVDEDDDDYLLYLEDILRRIHTEFYATLDQGNGRKSLRDIIPRVRSQVLKGLCLTFSGLIPTHQKLHQSRAYKVARAFGAEVTQVRNSYLLLPIYSIALL